MAERLVRRLPRGLRTPRRRTARSAGPVGPRLARAAARCGRGRRLCLAPVAELLSAYLITGTDKPKVTRALRRLRDRVGEDATEHLSAHEASGEDVAAACNALGLFTVERRLVVVEDVERWKAPDLKASRSTSSGRRRRPCSRWSATTSSATPLSPRPCRRRARCSASTCRRGGEAARRTCRNGCSSSSATVASRSTRRPLGPSSSWSERTPRSSRPRSTSSRPGRPARRSASARSPSSSRRGPRRRRST